MSAILRQRDCLPPPPFFPPFFGASREVRPLLAAPLSSCCLSSDFYECISQIGRCSRRLLPYSSSREVEQTFGDRHKPHVSIILGKYKTLRRRVPLFCLTPPPLSFRLVRLPRRLFQWRMHLWIGSPLPLDGEMVSFTFER